jgi:hypothetical protein
MVVSAFVAVVSYGAVEAGVTAAIGGAIAGEIGLDAAAFIVGETTVGQVIGGAVVGAGLNGLKSAATGGDFLEGALIGGITGGAGPVISGAASDIVGNEIAGSTTLAKGLAGALGGAGKGVLGSALSGGDPLRGALIGGLGGGITGAATEGFGLDKTQSALLGGGLNLALGQAFAPDAPTRTATAASVGPTTYSPTVTGQAPTQTSTATLGGALLASPTLGYTPGSSFLGGTDSSKPSQNVWNQASLKEGAQVGPGSDGSQAESS